MKISTFVAVLGWLSFFAVIWLFILGFLPKEPSTVWYPLLFLFIGGFASIIAMDTKKKPPTL